MACDSNNFWSNLAASYLWDLKACHASKDNSAMSQVGAMKKVWPYLDSA